MKKIFFLLFMTLFYSPSMMADEFNAEQLQLRLDVVKYLTANGYNPQKPDKDGDIAFKQDKLTFYVIINKNWVSPYIITLYAQFAYDEDMTQERVRNCISFIGQKYRGVKLFPATKNFSFRSDVFCNEASMFTNALSALLKEMKGAISEFLSIINGGIADIDLCDYDAIYSRARTLYFADEDIQALSLFKMLADADYTDAFSYVADCYRNGYGTEQDLDQASVYYQKGIDAGSMKCAYLLGNMQYKNGEYADAYKNYLMCGTNEGSYKSLALFKLGSMQERGEGTERNLTQAISSYKKSVQFSNVLECDARKALIRLNVPVENKADFVDATKTMLMGLSTKEMYDKGYEYEHGWNNRLVSLPKAYAYYKASADGGYTKAYSKMGEIYISQYYPFHDKKLSDKYYQKVFKLLKSKEGIDGEAAYELGRMFEYGFGVNKDFEQAQYYYKSGALLGDKNASWRFGMICKADLDYAEAFKYFKKAAEENQADAMFELAQCYENGTGTPLNRESAIQWYTRCSLTLTSASAEAMRALERLGSLGGKEQ